MGASVRMVPSAVSYTHLDVYKRQRNAQLKVLIPDEITVGELAARLKQQAGKVIAKFMQMGEMHAINDVIDFDTASLLAEEFLSLIHI